MTQEEQIKAMLDKLNIMLEYDEDIAVDSVDEIVDKFNEYVEENIPYKSYYKRKEASYDARK